MREALLWHSEDGRVRCRLCPHACKIAEGRAGVCGVRRNVGGVLYATTYGRVTSIAVDPIEKKPVYHYRPGTRALSLGSVGCTMRCLHCQNWQISRARPDDGALTDLPADDVPVLAEEHDCEGVAFTYNEPVIWAEYVLDVSRLCHERGIYTVMVTNGYITEEGLDLVGEHIDVWRVDIKGFDDDTLRELCRVPHVRPILDMTVRAQKRWDMHVEVVTNVVPGFNDSEETLREIAAWIAGALGPETPWHVTRFFPYLGLAHVPATPIETLLTGVRIGRESGLHHVYLGNVEESGADDTVCPDCGSLAIRRSGYRSDTGGLAGGGCAECGRDLNVVVGEREH